MLKTKTLEKYFLGKLYENSSKEITNLSFDSRDCTKGSAFFAFSGTVLNGNDYINEAIERGAILIVSNTLPCKLNEDISYFITDDNIRRVYSFLSHLFFNEPSKKLKIIGITGTDGKSSTAYFTYQLFHLLGIKAAILSTVYSDDGSGIKPSPFRQSTPDAFPLQSFLNDCVNNKVEYLVLETTSHALSCEFARLEGIEFIASIYTNITSEHLEFHKTHSSYVNAKCNLIDKTKGNVFAYSTNREIVKIRDKAKEKLIELTLPNIISRDMFKQTFIFDSKEYTLPFAQIYQTENAFSAAYALSTILNISLDSILSEFVNLKGVDGRFELVENDLGLNLIIDFAHTENSFNSLFSFMREINPNSRFITVFGSGGNRDRDKRAKMGKIADLYSSLIIITEEDPRSEGSNQIALDIISGIERRNKVFFIDKREEAIKMAISLADPTDTVFFLGKGHERSIQYEKESRYYNERKAIEEVLKKWTY